MNFEDFMDQMHAAYRAGKASAKRGFWYVAIYEYGQLLGMFKFMSIMVDQGSFKLTEQQQKQIAGLIAALELEYEKALMLSGNGHPQQNPPPGFSEALRTMKEDMAEIFA